jgi:hypothetical protein
VAIDDARRSAARVPVTASVDTSPPPELASLPRAPAGGKGLLIGVCCVAQFMVILDLSIVNVALPSIQSSLKFSASDLQWVVDAYATSRGLSDAAGRAGDLRGSGGRSSPPWPWLSWPLWPSSARPRSAG